MVFDQASPSVQQVFQMIEKSPVGRTLMKQVRPLVESGEIRIRSIQKSFLKQMAIPPLESGSPGALFFFDGVERSILCDFSKEIGLLAPILFHELSHSVDEQYLRSYAQLEILNRRLQSMAMKIMKRTSERTGKPMDVLLGSDCTLKDFRRLMQLRRKGEIERQRRQCNAEVRAYRLQGEFVQEMIHCFPEYRVYLREAEVQGYRFLEPYCREEICKKYEFDLVA